mmetsp:Transcript_79532/g.228259  ORF Transcript_79532/g.228259 Transcript_79532/m.228259 type:complete len:251 (-) Transcript_79532:540-1292(-)
MRIEEAGAESPWHCKVIRAKEQKGYTEMQRHQRPAQELPILEEHSLQHRQCTHQHGDEPLHDSGQDACAPLLRVRLRVSDDMIKDEYDRACLVAVLKRGADSNGVLSPSGFRAHGLVSLGLRRLRRGMLLPKVIVLQDPDIYGFLPLAVADLPEHQDGDDSEATSAQVEYQLVGSPRRRGHVDILESGVGLAPDCFRASPNQYSPMSCGDSHQPTLGLSPARFCQEIDHSLAEELHGAGLAHFGAALRRR